MTPRVPGGSRAAAHQVGNSGRAAPRPVAFVAIGGPMRLNALYRLRPLAAFAAAVCATSMSAAAATPAAAARVQRLPISIVGNHFVNGAGHRIRLLGVNHTSAEYGCVDGFGYDDGHFNNRDAAAIASWGANAVRVP